VGQNVSCGTNVYRAVGLVDASVSLWVVDLTSGTTFAAPMNPVHFVRIGSSGTPAVSTGMRNITLNLTGSMVAYHLYEIDTSVHVYLHAMGSGCTPVSIGS